MYFFYQIAYQIFKKLLNVIFVFELGYLIILV